MLLAVWAFQLVGQRVLSFSAVLVLLFMEVDQVCGCLLHPLMFEASAEFEAI